MKRLFFLFLVGALLSGAPNGRAAVRAEAVTLGVGAGEYFFDSQENLEDSPIYSLSLGYNFTEHWTAEATGSYFKTEPENISGVDINGWSGRIDLVYNFAPRSPLVPYLAVGAGGLLLDPDGGATDKDGFVDWGLGLKYYFNDGVALRLDGRHYITAENEQFDGDEYQNFSATGGLQFQFGSEDRGVVPVDLDGDGVADIDDRCPDTPQGTTVDMHGCPADTDGDGVIDDLDQCPGTSPEVSVDPRGCPPAEEAPAILDEDRDGVADDMDRCPGTEAGMPVDDAGCPEQERDSLTLQIEFGTGRADLTSQARAELQKAIAFVKVHPEAKIVVEGHTDSVGPATYNQFLSQQRAESVRRFLLDELGVDPERIVARGYGETRPVANNSSPGGRQQNRRVVIGLEE